MWFAISLFIDTEIVTIVKSKIFWNRETGEAQVSSFSMWGWWALQYWVDPCYNEPHISLTMLWIKQNWIRMERESTSSRSFSHPDLSVDLSWILFREVALARQDRINGFGCGFSDRNPLNRTLLMAPSWFLESGAGRDEFLLWRSLLSPYLVSGLHRCCYFESQVNPLFFARHLIDLLCY